MRSWQFVDLLPRQADPCLDRITALAGSRGSAGMPTMAARDGNVARHQMVRAQAQGAVKCQRLLAVCDAVLVCRGAFSMSFAHSAPVVVQKV
jgi:hypothetical protein